MKNNDKQKLIYNSAVKLFWKIWVKKVSIDMIVKDAGIAKWTFYLYYKNKEKLYEEIIDIFSKEGMNFHDDIIKKIPNTEERFFIHMVGSVWYFQDNQIVKNLIYWNPDYFIWAINHDFLFALHIKMLKKILWDEFSDPDFINIVAQIKSFYATVINSKSWFTQESEYEKFVMNLASVISKWLFSDFKSIQWNKSFKEIVAYIPKN